ncbi:MAG TPA: hypothetical protein VLA34_06345 [Candidatus Krumholzibacterium sp.]|nr:hypothetical protein [Candidatus Krumholzibacterium sp.]
MAGKYEETDLSRVRTIPFAQRTSKVSVEHYGDPVEGGETFSRWFRSLPDQLAGREVRVLIEAMKRVRSGGGGEVIWMTGAHVIKCGLPPFLIRMMDTGYLTTLAVNGACAIHDTEIAFFGETSEDVPDSLEKGIFGFAAETGRILFEAVEEGRRDGLGLGESIGRHIGRSGAPNREQSLFFKAYEAGVPVTVHIGIGTDIVNQHPGFDGAAWGELSHRDFRIFSARVEKAGASGGVVINAGSAVILPEVFLKAISIARNRGISFSSITTCNIDMLQHYRPMENVLRRPTAFGGRAVSLTGHHEILIPLIYSALA